MLLTTPRILNLYLIVLLFFKRQLPPMRSFEKALSFSVSHRFSDLREKLAFQSGKKMFKHLITLYKRRKLAG